MLNELRASSAFDCSCRESCYQAALHDSEKEDGRSNRDHCASGNQAPFYLQALQKALQTERQRLGRLALRKDGDKKVIAPGHHEGKKASHYQTRQGDGIKNPE